MGNPFERPPFEKEPKDPVEQTCPLCHGKGVIKDKDGKEITCPKCHGKGYIITYRR